MDVHVLKNLLKEETWFKLCVEVCVIFLMLLFPFYEGWNFNSGNYLFTTDTK